MTKEKNLKIRVTEQEHAEIKELADKYGLSISSFIRFLLAKEKRETGKK